MKVNVQTACGSFWSVTDTVANVKAEVERWVSGLASPPSVVTLSTESFIYVFNVEMRWWSEERIQR